LARLIDARLLAVEGGDREQATVEIVHESLIERWPQLAGWLHEERENAQFLGRLHGAAKEWEASGQAEGLVWSGESAREAQRWFELHQGDGSAMLSRREREFLQAVIAVRTRSRHRRRRLIGLSFVALSAAVALSSNLAWRERRAKQTAQQAKQAAEQAVLGARDATRLAAARLNSDDPTTQLALLREIEGSAPPPEWAAETQRVLHSGVALVPHRSRQYGVALAVCLPQPCHPRTARRSLDRHSPHSSSCILAALRPPRCGREDGYRPASQATMSVADTMPTTRPEADVTGMPCRWDLVMSVAASATLAVSGSDTTFRLMTSPTTAPSACT